MYTNEDGEKKTYSQLAADTNSSFPKDKPPEGWSIYIAPVDADAIALSEARFKRDSEQYSEIEVDGMVFDANQQSQRNIEVAIRKFDLIATDGVVMWTLADNSVVPITKAQLTKVEDAITLRYSQLHREYTEFKLSLQE